MQIRNWTPLKCPFAEIRPSYMCNLLALQQVPDVVAQLVWCTMLLAGSSPIRIPVWLICFNSPNPSSRTMAPGIGFVPTRNEYQGSSWGKVRPTRKADQFTAYENWFSRTCGSLDVSQHCRPLRPFTGIFLIYFNRNCRHYPSSCLRNVF
jgi:hypothetical protein